MIAMPISSNYVASLAPDDMRGRYMGVLGFSWNTAVGVGPMVGLFIFGRSPELLWTLCGITGVVAASLILVRTRVARIQENLTPLRADH
jgi:MFS family permease